MAFIHSGTWLRELNLRKSLFVPVIIAAAMLAGCCKKETPPASSASDDLVWMARQIDKNPQVAIPAGHFIGGYPEQIFEQKALPRDSVPWNAIRNIEDLKKKFVMQAMVKGTVCTLKNIGDVQDFNPDMKTGFVAQAVPVMPANGFIKPGSHVNVLATMQVPGKAQKETKVILKNIKVLAVNQIETLADGNINRPVMVLEMSVDDDLILVNAIAHGTISLALVNPKDVKPAKPIKE